MKNWISGMNSESLWVFFTGTTSILPPYQVGVGGVCSTTMGSEKSADLLVEGTNSVLKIDDEKPMSNGIVGKVPNLAAMSKESQEEC